MRGATSRGGDARHREPSWLRIGCRVGIALLLASTLGCESGPPVPPKRLVDPGYRAGMIADFGQGPIPVPTSTAPNLDHPRAQIRDETRLVLAAPASGTPIWWPRMDVPSAGVVQTTVDLDEAFAGSSRLLLMPRAHVGTEWIDLPTRIVDVANQEGHPKITVDLHLPDAVAGQQVELTVSAIAIDWGPEITLRTPPLEVPKGSRLDLAMGVLEPSWGQGPMLFIVEACRQHDCERIHETRIDAAQEVDRGWREASIDLDRYGGTSVSLVFRSTLSPASGEKFSLPVWANPTIRVPRKADRSAPNVVLLSVDTLSARHLPTYGYFRDTAPLLTREFELGGTVFDNCVAAATSTPQAHMSMFTGLQPLEHGLTAGVEVLDPALLTVTEQIRSAGVATGAVTEDGWLGAEHGFGRGFDEYKENKSADIMAPSGQVDKTFAAAKVWLQRHADQRFFLFLHTFQVHDPYAPPPEYASLFPTDAAGAAITTDAPSHVDKARRYDQEIRYVDDEIGALLAELDALGLSRNTVFIVTSDHGEGFLEHGFFLHSTFLFEEVTHVPLLMRGPGVPRGLRISAPVGHVDLTNTLASIFDVQPPPGSRGIDLRRTFHDKNSVADGAFYFTESWGSVAIGPEGSLINFFTPAFSVRQGQRKAARYRNEDGSHRSECYDVDLDPGEQTNLCVDGTPEPPDLAAALDAYKDVTARRRAQILPPEGAQREEPSTLPLDPKQQEKLRALGYMQ